MSVRIPRLAKKQRIILAGILVALSFILDKTIGLKPVTIIVMLVSTITAGTPIFLKAVEALKYRIVGIDALVTIAVTGFGTSADVAGDSLPGCLGHFRTGIHCRRYWEWCKTRHTGQERRDHGETGCAQSYRF